MNDVNSQAITVSDRGRNLNILYTNADSLGKDKMVELEDKIINDQFDFWQFVKYTPK